MEAVEGIGVEGRQKEGSSGEGHHDAERGSNSCGVRGEKAERLVENECRVREMRSTDCCSKDGRQRKLEKRRRRKGGKGFTAVSLLQNPNDIRCNIHKPLD